MGCRSEVSSVEGARLDCALEEAGAARLHGLHGLGRERLRMRPAVPAATQPGLWPPPQHRVVRVVVYLENASVFRCCSLG